MQPKEIFIHGLDFLQIDPERAQCLATKRLGRDAVATTNWLLAAIDLSIPRNIRTSVTEVMENLWRPTAPVGYL